MYITQTAVMPWGKRYEPLFLCNRPTDLGDCQWSGNVRQGLDFKSMQEINKILHELMKYKNPAYEYGVTDGVAELRARDY